MVQTFLKRSRSWPCDDGDECQRNLETPGASKKQTMISKTCVSVRGWSGSHSGPRRRNGTHLERSRAAVRSESSGGLLDRIVEGRGDLVVAKKPGGVASGIVDSPGVGVVTQSVFAVLHLRPADIGSNLGGVGLGSRTEGREND